MNSEVTTAVQGVLTTVTSSVNVANVITLATTGLAVSLGFVLAWFGIRKLIHVIQNAMSSGNVSL